MCTKSHLELFTDPPSKSASRTNFLNAHASLDPFPAYSPGMFAGWNVARTDLNLP